MGVNVYKFVCICANVFLKQGNMTKDQILMKQLKTREEKRIFPLSVYPQKTLSLKNIGKH